MRDQVDHAAEGGGAVERRPGALHHLDPLYVGERHHVPVDPTPVALVRRYAVDEQQHARSEASTKPLEPRMLTWPFRNSTPGARLTASSTVATARRAGLGSFLTATLRAESSEGWGGFA